MINDISIQPGGEEGLADCQTGQTGRHARGGRRIKRPESNTGREHLHFSAVVVEDVQDNVLLLRLLFSSSPWNFFLLHYLSPVLHNNDDKVRALRSATVKLAAFPRHVIKLSQIMKRIMILHEESLRYHRQNLHHTLEYLTK